MLTIVKNLSAVLSRPKYYRHMDHQQWVVWDTDKKQRVYGPNTHRACIQYMQREELNGG